MGDIIEGALLQLEGKERILTDIVAVILFVVFLSIAFRGYKLFKFVVGFETAALVFVLLGLLDWAAIVCVLIALIVGYLVYTFYEKMLTVIVFLVTGLLSLVICGIGFAMNSMTAVILSLLAAILAAFLVYKFTKIFIIIYTSIQFGFLCGTMVNYVFNDPFDGFKLIAQIAFSALAIYMQYKKYGFGKEKSVSDFSWKESLAKLEDANANPQITVINNKTKEDIVQASAQTITQDITRVNHSQRVELPRVSKKTYYIVAGVLGGILLVVAWVFTIRALLAHKEENAEVSEAVETVEYEEEYRDYDNSFDKHWNDNRDDYEWLQKYSIENDKEILDRAYIESGNNEYQFATLRPKEPDFLLPFIETYIYSYFEVAFFDGEDWSIIDTQSLLDDEDPYDGYWEDVSSFGKLTFDDEQHYYVEVYATNEYSTKYVYGLSNGKPCLLLSDNDIYQTQNGTFCRAWGESGIVNIEVDFDGEKYVQFSSKVVSEERMRSQFDNFESINKANIAELFNQKTIYLEGWDECNIDNVIDANLVDIRKGSNDKYYFTYEYKFYASYATDESYEIDQVFYYTYRTDDDELIKEEGDEFINFDRKQDSSRLDLPVE